MSPRFYLLAALAALGMLRGCIVPAPVDAQSDDALWLARICVHESGWDSLDDCAGIHAVLTRTAERRGVSYLTALRSYSPRFYAGTSARPWARLLADSDAPPAGLGASWRHPRGDGLLSRRDAFAVVLEHCRRIMAEPPTCAADDWGTARDHERARLAGRRFRFVDCGSTRNLFSQRLGRAER